MLSLVLWNASMLRRAFKAGSMMILLKKDRCSAAATIARRTHALLAAFHHILIGSAVHF
jgi:hypothetical protein